MLNYEDIRSEIKSGDVISYKHRISPLKSFYDFKIWLIRIFNTTDVTHVGVAWVVADRVFILEAVSSGVRNYPLSLAGQFRWTPRGIWSMEKEIKAMSKMGQPYSYIEVGKTLFKRLNMSSGVWHCAKYLCDVLSLDIQPMTPESVVDYLEEQENLPTYTVTVKKE